MSASLKPHSLIFICWIIMGAGYGQKASKNIPLSKELLGASMEWKVKTKAVLLGNQQPSFRFGGYQMLDSKREGYSSHREKDREKGTVEQYEEIATRFMMQDEGNHSVEVSALRLKYTKETRPSGIALAFLAEDGEFSFQLRPEEEAELLESSEFLTAEIVPGEDKGRIRWILIMGIDDEGLGEPQVGFLRHGEQTIRIEPISSEGEKNELPGFGNRARGHVFYKGDHYLGAVQYSGKGMMQMRNQLVWFNPSVDPDLQRILATAMGLLLQVHAL